MHVVGGLYRELCDVPFWDETFGSGARAASAILAQCGSVHLHTYASSADHHALSVLQDKGIDLHVSVRPSPIVFAYFHALSTPHIQPAYSQDQQQGPLFVNGESVLRFGFLEGDAIVTADRAVYDPQTWRNPAPFAANGSKANRLAVVLNELELRHASGFTDINQAALHIIYSHGADVVVVKMGAQGVIVFERSGQVSYIPVYPSSKVFKIGTGDIFSAIFAFHWAECGIGAVKAADLASRSVSVYCENQKFIFDLESLMRRRPVMALTKPSVRLEGSAESLGQRFVLEEARQALRDFGMVVHCPELESKSNVHCFKAVLAIDDGLGENALSRIVDAKSHGIPIIILHERMSTRPSMPEIASITDDFTTAIYLTVWAAANATSVANARMHEAPLVGHRSDCN